MARSRPDPVRIVAETNRGRDPVLLRRKFDAMSRDAFAFLRATARLGHASVDLAALPRAPVAWICGDLHLQNFGCFRGANRLVYFDLNDFDEAGLLPVPLDLVRLLASLLCAAPSLPLPAREARRAALAATRAYGEALAHGKAMWLERETATGPLRELLRQVDRRKRRSLLETRTVRSGGQRRIRIDGDHHREVDEEDPVREQIAFALGEIAAERGERDFFRPRDVARRVAGMGSLGVDRYIVLVRGRGDPDRNALIDFKLAVPSAALLALPSYRQPAWASEAERVTTVQEYCQAASPAYLGTSMLGGRAFIVRELQPVEDRMSFGPLARHAQRLDETLAGMARLGAWAHLRAASRRGACGIDDLVAYAPSILSRPLDWVEAAIEVNVRNREAHASFRRAWRAKDQRLCALCRPPA